MGKSGGTCGKSEVTADGLSSLPFLDWSTAVPLNVVDNGAGPDGLRDVRGRALGLSMLARAGGKRDASEVKYPVTSGTPELAWKSGQASP